MIVRKKYEIAALGFYADNNIQSFVCFSCMLIVRFKDWKDIHEHHRKTSPFCAFIQGRDVSIGDDKPRTEFSPKCQGFTNFSNIETFNRRLSDANRNKVLRHYSLNTPYLNAAPTLKSYVLTTIFSPVYIPKLLRSDQENRLKTFNVHTYTFPPTASDFPYPEISDMLARNGFFYTLYNSVIQCAFCRVVISNITHITMEEDVLSMHAIFSRDCQLISGKDVGNIPRIITHTATPTENESHQCKVCLINQIDVIYKCGHFVVCSSCATQMNSCPTCRAPLHDMRLSFKMPSDITEIFTVDYELKNKFKIYRSSRPLYHSFSSRSTRLKSFVGEIWTKIPIHKSEMAKAGFFSIQSSDRVACFHCGFGLCNWELDDDPWIEHNKWSKNCHYVQLNSDTVRRQECKFEFLMRHFILHGFQTDIVKQLNNTYSAAKIRDALMNKFTKDGRDFTSVDELKAQLEHKPVTRHSYDKSKECIICLDEEISVSFLPCGHTVCCSFCAPSFTSCVLCRDQFSILRLVRTRNMQTPIYVFNDNWDTHYTFTADDDNNYASRYRRGGRRLPIYSFSTMYSVLAHDNYSDKAFTLDTEDYNISISKFSQPFHAVITKTTFKPPKFKFKHPFTCIVSGMTSSGKTVLIKRVPSIDDIKKHKPDLIVLDDLMDNITDNASDIARRRSLPFLRYATKKPTGSRRRILKDLGAEKTVYNALQELAHNTLSGVIPLNPKQKKLLQPHRKTLENLCDCKNRKSIKKRKQLILQSGGFLPIVLSALAGVLPTLLSKAFMSDPIPMAVYPYDMEENLPPPPQQPIVNDVPVGSTVRKRRVNPLDRQTLNEMVKAQLLELLNGELPLPPPPPPPAPPSPPSPPLPPPPPPYPMDQITAPAYEPHLSMPSNIADIPLPPSPLSPHPPTKRKSTEVRTDADAIPHKLSITDPWNIPFNDSDDDTDDI
ncbi:unnamed protein product [Medioppia subpectinata]|uniref:RING-type domain-containing protein n=1 Tax=Medioppia subpectinata TaxID=1979941 RepID=A0A7R9KH14_9ACAR|nr:unnamed protein product [Medioppia subpectinata]CAG2102052.1 unnamed protein product [Medioppia subpectinata]